MLVLAETKQASEIIYWSAWVCKLDNEEELSKQVKAVSGQSRNVGKIQTAKISPQV